MTKKINKSVCVIDHCEYTFIAAELTKYFDKVYYASDYSSGFPYIGAELLGSGIEGVTKILDVQDYEDEIDVFIFPDLYFCPLAERLKREGRLVWGSGKMEYIERDRKLFLEKLKECGLPVPDTDFIKGLDKLMSYLEGKEDVWVKLSEFRGVAETFHYIDKRYNEFLINEIKTKLGCFKDEVDFQVQKPIETVIEYGSDGYIIDGKFPDYHFLGFEKKAVQYIGKFVNRHDTFKERNEICDKWGKILKENDYTGFYSDEVRVDDKGTHLFIDPCCRCPFPATASWLHAVTNWGNIIWDGVNGKLTEMKSQYKYVAEIVLKTACKEFTPLYYENSKDGVFMPTTYSVRDNIAYRVPENQLYCDSNKAGSAVGGGNTLEEAIENCTKVLGTVRGQQLDYENTLVEFSGEVIDKLKKQVGYKF